MENQTPSNPLSLELTRIKKIAFELEGDRLLYALLAGTPANEAWRFVMDFDPERMQAYRGDGLTKVMQLYRLVATSDAPELKTIQGDDVSDLAAINVLVAASRFLLATLGPEKFGEFKRLNPARRLRGIRDWLVEEGVL